MHTSDWLTRCCSFLVKFLILVVLIGVPWCFMEIAVGQYSGRGPTAIGDMVPIGKGVAVAMGYICFLNVVCYSPIQSRCLFYMFWSLPESDQLPWKQCISENGSLCLTDDKKLSACECKTVGFDLRVPAENFYLHEIVQLDRSVLYDGIGNFNVPLLLCLIISWMVNYLLLIASNDFMKYVQIFGSVAPFTLLAFVLFIMMVDNDAWGGFHLLFDTSTIDFLDLQSWRRAAEQVLYSLDVGTGHLIIYGANRSFHNNILGGVLLVALLDTVCAVAATIVVFATANIEASKFNIEFSLVFKSGPGMFFIAISRVFADLPFPRLLNFVSFFILFVVCILTQLSFLKPVIYLWNVYFPDYSQQQSHNRAKILCTTMFVLSLITVTKSGEMIISILDDIGSAMGILMITTFEAILIFGIYGVSEFCVDLTFMSKKPPSIILKLLFIGSSIFTINFYGSFEPTDRWVPDLSDLLINDELNPITFEGEKMTYDSLNHLEFGIGKPKICVKLDSATQTDETNNDQSEHIVMISNQRLQHFYLEVLKITNSPFEIERRHNEIEVLAWNNIMFQEHLIDRGLLEKYVQTD
ncbi:hypothetical protein ACI65C_005320 [Semiaphis heraclei]